MDSTFFMARNRKSTYKYLIHQLKKSNLHFSKMAGELDNLNMTPSENRNSVLVIGYEELITSEKSYGIPTSRCYST
jgi:hypothetical protein